MANTTTLKLDERLRRRIALLARAAQQTPHAWMVERARRPRAHRAR
jgi:predicted transcriptional regulator